MKIVIEVSDTLMEYIVKGRDLSEEQNDEMALAIANGTPLSQTIDSLKELSKDHRHNFVGDSCEERACRLGIEDSIDLILAEREE
jgi:hypothetical protein